MLLSKQLTMSCASSSLIHDAQNLQDCRTLMKHINSQRYQGRTPFALGFALQ